MRKSVWFIMGIMLVVSLGCGSSTFYDDFEDGSLNPAYVLFGYPAEENGVLQTGDSTILLPYVPGPPPGIIERGISVEVDVLDPDPGGFLFLGVGSPNLDGYVICLLAGTPMCLNSQGYFSPIGIDIETPLTLSIRVEANGLTTGSFKDSSGAYECPDRLSVGPEPLGIGLGSAGRLGPGNSTIDNLSVYPLE